MRQAATSMRSPLRAALVCATAAAFSTSVCNVVFADDTSSASVAPTPLAGYHDGLFYMRDEADQFRLYVQGRVHVDGVEYLGPGVSSMPASNALHPTLFLRRARLELAGEFFGAWQWQLSGELSAYGNDNPGATAAQNNCTVDAVSGALTCSPKSNPVDAAQVKPIPTDVFVNYVAKRWLNVQVGQYLVPFTMENRISDNTTPFLERSLAVRDLGVPSQRDIGAMVWGEAKDALVYYSAGIYNGDGPNHQNVDNRFDYVGRFFTRPLASQRTSPSHDLQLGVSARGGSRDHNYVGYDLPALTTQGGFAFWSPTYKDSMGRLIHIIPSTQQWALAADAFIPIDRFDLTSELVYMHDNTREAEDGYQLADRDDRLGYLRGYGYYVQAGYWLMGTREVIGFPAYGKPLHADLTKPSSAPQQGVQVLAKFERIHVTYSSAGRAGTPDSKSPDGDIDVNAYSLGANYWATRNVRVTLNYVGYVFPSSEPTSASTAGAPIQNSTQRAIAPAQTLAKGVDDSARNDAHTLHEISVRFGVQF
jgi:hypothetical protein